jgi:hypothetical protein
MSDIRSYRRNLPKYGYEKGYVYGYQNRYPNNIPIFDFRFWFGPCRHHEEFRIVSKTSENSWDVRRLVDRMIENDELIIRGNKVYYSMKRVINMFEIYVS